MADERDIVQEYTYTLPELSPKNTLAGRKNRVRFMRPPAGASYFDLIKIPNDWDLDFQLLTVKNTIWSIRSGSFAVDNLVGDPTNISLHIAFGNETQEEILDGKLLHPNMVMQLLPYEDDPGVDKFAAGVEAFSRRFNRQGRYFGLNPRHENESVAIMGGLAVGAVVGSVAAATFSEPEIARIVTSLGAGGAFGGMAGTVIGTTAHLIVDGYKARKIPDHGLYLNDHNAKGELLRLNEHVNVVALQREVWSALTDRELPLSASNFLMLYEEMQDLAASYGKNNLQNDILARMNEAPIGIPLKDRVPVQGVKTMVNLMSKVYADTRADERSDAENKAILGIVDPRKRTSQKPAPKEKQPAEPEEEMF